MSQLNSLKTLNQLEYIPKKIDSISIRECFDASIGFMHLPKIQKIRLESPHLIEDTIHWPSGDWGQGYASMMTDSVLFTANYQGNYFSCSPLIRVNCNFIRGHIQLYLAGYKNETNAKIITTGIQQLLNRQVNSGKNKGGFPLIMFRQSQLTAEDNLKKIAFDSFETCYALKTLSEFYQTEIPKNEKQILAAIENATQFLRKQNWKSSNSNVRGLALWALCESYKITKSQKTYHTIKKIATILLHDQNQSNEDWDGCWLTGGIEENPHLKEQIYHDTKIFYFFMTLRGLIEVYPILYSTDQIFKNNMLKSIKKSMNHVILYRFASTEPTNGSLFYLYKTVSGKNVYIIEQDPDNLEKYIETIVKLYTYAQQDNSFSAEEKTTLLQLVCKMSYQIDPSNKWHITALGYYLNYFLKPNYE